MTFTVDDLGVAIEQLEREGRWELFGEDRTASDWQHVFIRPSTNEGALVQIAQSSPPAWHTVATLQVDDILAGRHGLGTPSP